MIGYARHLVRLLVWIVPFIVSSFTYLAAEWVSRIALRVSDWTYARANVDDAKAFLEARKC